ncbi:hypothetical protein PPTG_21863 [Phytophthora nicotianae INRA-310]|uniref:Uncharacterized protein n=1 Tax=Phytophthora nicotianae (strain INRA-310) TaxID=761204 RepID=W2QSY9_PHYN3|nr:hypothetical protein PPTG_21863 [Phytophthora nicotianae INRA-310]ETN16091.1 hypothetical protein PPTG_21863 [Phytophthora nicotianae INRA-310]
MLRLRIPAHDGAGLAAISPSPVPYGGIGVPELAVAERLQRRTHSELIRTGLSGKELPRNALIAPQETETQQQ